MSQPASRFYEFGPFRIDAEKRVLLREGEAVPLVPKAFDMLLALVRHRGEVLEKDRLLEIVWPDSIVKELDAELPDLIVEKQTISRLIIEEQSGQEKASDAELECAVSPHHLRPGLTALLAAGLVVAALSGLSKQKYVPPHNIA